MYIVFFSVFICKNNLHKANLKMLTLVCLCGPIVVVELSSQLCGPIVVVELKSVEP